MSVNLEPMVQVPPAPKTHLLDCSHSCPQTSRGSPSIDPGRNFRDCPIQLFILQTQTLEPTRDRYLAKVTHLIDSRTEDRIAQLQIHGLVCHSSNPFFCSPPALAGFQTLDTHSPHPPGTCPAAGLSPGVNDPSWPGALYLWGNERGSVNTV